MSCVLGSFAFAMAPDNTVCFDIMPVLAGASIVVDIRGECHSTPFDMIAAACQITGGCYKPFPA